MTSDFPLISVVMPTYNGEKTIKKAIESILSQTYPKIEIIVVDDQSTDNTSSVVKSIIDQRVKYFKLPQKGNGSVARNLGIRKASGDWIALLDDDDQWLPNKLLVQYEYIMSKDPNEWKAVGCSKYYGENDNWKKVILEKEGDLRADILQMNISISGGSSLLMTKKVLNELGGFDESFQRHQDMELELRYLRKYKLAIVKEPLVKVSGHQFRIWGKPEESKAQRLFLAKENFLKVFKNDIDSLGKTISNKIYARHWLQGARYFAVEGNLKNTFKYLLKSLSYSFLFSKKYVIIPFETYFVIPWYLLLGSVSNLRKKF